jgi:hypothetical protein
MSGAGPLSKARRHAGWHERLSTQPLTLAAEPLPQNQMNQPYGARAVFEVICCGLLAAVLFLRRA